MQKVPKSEICENLNMRKLSDLQYRSSMSMWSVLTFLMLTYLYINHGVQKVFSLKVFYLTLSASFKYLYYGSTTIRIFYSLTMRGSTLDTRI